MKTDDRAPTTIDEYIAGFPAAVQAILQEVRRTIREAAPDAQEAMKYGLPTFTLSGNLVHFGAFSSHIGFYPAPTGLEAFKEEMAPYRSSKGTAQFPLDQPIPYDLITRIVKYRVAENLARAEAKKKRK